MIYNLDTEPKLNEIVLYKIASVDPDYNFDWIEGELILRINCEDGIALIFYMPREINKSVGNENAPGLQK